MAYYQARGWQVWHHHMVLGVITLMVLAKDCLAHRQINASTLSYHDLIDILRNKQPKSKPMMPRHHDRGPLSITPERDSTHLPKTGQTPWAIKVMPNLNGDAIETDDGVPIKQ